MIKFDTNEAKIGISGSVIDVASESMFMIRQIYKLICEENKDAGEKFKKLICTDIEDCFLSDEEILKRTEEMEKRVERISKLFDILKEMSGVSKDKKTEETPENKDIRQADFDSEKAFDEWFHGQEE